MQVRAPSRVRSRQRNDDLFLVDALTDVEPHSEARQMAIAGLNAIRMPQLERYRSPPLRPPP